MKFLVSSLLTVFAILACLALPACSGASGGLGAGDGGSGSGSGSGGGSSSGGSSGSGSSSGGEGEKTTCSAATQCGTGTRTYEECTTVSSATGVCKAIGYKTSDGMTFTCHGCTNCNDAAKELSDYCSGIGPGDGGTGTTTCSPAQACGTTGTTFQECTTVSQAGTCTGIEYKLSNGTNFACASCGDCSTAVSQLDTFCQGGGTPTTSCTTWSTCGTSSLQYEECTTSISGVCQAMYYETSDTNMFQCAGCGNCTTAGTSMETYCASMSQTTSCGTASACGSTGVTYDLCTTSQAGSCVSEYYSTSDGNAFTCNSCSDCSAAVMSLGTYCASLGGVTCGGTTCTTGDICCSCGSPAVQECLSSNGGTYTCATYGCL